MLKCFWLSFLSLSFVFEVFPVTTSTTLSLLSLQRVVFVLVLNKQEEE